MVLNIRRSRNNTIVMICILFSVLECISLAFSCLLLARVSVCSHFCVFLFLFVYTMHATVGLENATEASSSTVTRSEATTNGGNWLRGKCTMQITIARDNTQCYTPHGSIIFVAHIFFNATCCIWCALRYTFCCQTALSFVCAFTISPFHHFIGIIHVTDAFSKSSVIAVNKRETMPNGGMAKGKRTFCAIYSNLTDFVTCVLSIGTRVQTSDVARFCRNGIG